MADCNYRPCGELMGDTKPMKDRGTKTGFTGDTYGADVSTDATNSMGKIKSSTKSDPADESMPGCC